MSRVRNTLKNPIKLNQIQEASDSDEDDEKKAEKEKIDLPVKSLISKKEKVVSMFSEKQKQVNKSTAINVRFRSRSENLTSCSIFKFMEGVSTSKASMNINSVFN